MIGPAATKGTAQVPLHTSEIRRNAGHLEVSAHSELHAPYTFRKVQQYSAFLEMATSLRHLHVTSTTVASTSKRSQTQSSLLGTHTDPRYRSRKVISPLRLAEVTVERTVVELNRDRALIDPTR